MEQKFAVTNSSMEMKFYLTFNGWRGQIKDSEKLLYPEEEAVAVAQALSYLEEDGHVYGFEEVSVFKYLREDAVYSPERHCTEYMKPEVAMKFAKNYKDEISETSLDGVLFSLEYATLASAFSWESTPEGYAYWEGVAKELKSLANE